MEEDAKASSCMFSFLFWLILLYLLLLDLWAPNLTHFSLFIELQNTQTIVKFLQHYFQVVWICLTFRRSCSIFFNLIIKYVYFTAPRSHYSTESGEFVFMCKLAFVSAKILQGNALGWLSPLQLNNNRFFYICLFRMVPGFIIQIVMTCAHIWTRCFKKPLVMCAISWNYQGLSFMGF